MQTLHDHNLMPTGQVIQARSHGAIPPFHRGVALGIRCRLIHRMWIIPPREAARRHGRPRHRSHDPVAGAGIFETVLLVLVAAELVPVAPALLIPIRFDQATAFDTVAGGQRLAITAKQPSRFGMINPNPCRPEYGGEEHLACPGGMLIIRWRRRPSATACKCSHTACTCMPSTKGGAGSSIGHACNTTPCSLLLAINIFRGGRFSAGLLEDGVELLQLGVSEFTVIELVIV